MAGVELGLDSVVSSQAGLYPTQELIAIGIIQHGQVDTLVGAVHGVDCGHAGGHGEGNHVTQGLDFLVAFQPSFTIRAVNAGGVANSAGGRIAAGIRILVGVGALRLRIGGRIRSLTGAIVYGDILAPIVAASVRSSITAEVAVGRSSLTAKGTTIIIISNDQSFQSCVPLINSCSSSIRGKLCTCRGVVHIDVGLGGAVSHIQQVTTLHSLNINRNCICFVSRAIKAAARHSANEPQRAIGVIGSNLICSADN